MSSLDSSSDGAYDVFLSFRGLDTRQGFTDTLYNILLGAGIRVFRDDDEMRPGDRLDNTILQAVRDSKICIPIFSKNYATSKWCLKELAEMVKWEKITVPILFDVEPDDVKLGTALYRDQLEVHEKNGQQDVNLWREALKKVGATKLSKLDKKGHYDFCKELVKEDISGRLKIKQKHVTDHLVGLDTEVELAMNLINEDDSEVLLGIHGIGGVGKTTLAKIIFNKLSASFDATAFLEGIRESSRTGIEHLQKMLLSDLSDRLKDAVGFVDPMVLMKANFTNKKVLIVLDDVVEKNQIENLVGKSSCFGSGSRIVVTTRDKRVLNIEQHESSSSSGRLRVIRTMEIWGLKSPRDLELFSRHAFGSDMPGPDYRHLSKEIVSTVQGLPLALEVVGSSLRGKFNPDTCRSTIERLKVTPDPEVKKTLRTSFDALDEREQQIFLDVACFFIPNNNTSDQQDTSMNSYLREHYLQLELDTLSSMSLIGESNNAVRMHDQIRDLGRDIARNRSSKYAKNCRLWVHEEAVKTLKSKRDNENIITLRLEQPCSNGDLTGDEFVDLRNLRLLSLKEPNFPKGFKGSLPMLTYLSMHGCPDTLSTNNLDSSRLLVLDLSYSKIDSKWKGWRHFQTNSLKVLDLSHCLELTSTPDLSKMEHLEKLVLEGCSNLKKIKASKDNLKSLRHVNLKGCSSLTTLPKELFASGNLESLSLHGCTQINQLPDMIKRSKSSLLTLDLSRTSIKQIPEFLGDFKKLRDLSLEGLEINHLPSSVICALESLVSLDCSNCKNLKELPDGIMTSLERLLLVGCDSMKKLPETLPWQLVTLDLSQSGITELPDSVGKLTRLETLLIAECKEISKLPDSVGDLVSLKVLIANCSAIIRLPASIGKLKNLERLEMAGSALRRLPREIGDVSGLRSLNLSGTRIRQLPSTLSQLSRLTTLELVDCDHLRELTDLPGSLTKLHVKSRRLKKVPDLAKLGNLTDLKLIDGSSLKRWTRVESSSLQSITKLSKLTKLELHLSNLTNLPSNLKALSQLESVVIECPSFKSFPELPSSVLELSLLSISSSVRVRHLSALTNLKVLRIQGFTDLSSLHLPDNLESLWLCNCPSLPNDFLSNSVLKKLVHLEVVRCSKVIEISGIETAESLERLLIESCELLEKIGDLSGARHLLHLKVTDCPKARTIQGLNELSAKSTTDFSGSDFLRAMKMSEVSVALSSIPKAMISIPGSGYLKAKFNEQQELYEKAQKMLNISDKVSLRIPGTELLVSAFVTHKDELHSITRSISTRLAKKIFSKFRRNKDVNQIMRTARRDDCYLTWLQRSEELEDLASEKEWSEYDESEDEDDTTEVINVVQKYPDIRFLLVSPGRDFLIQNDGSQVRIDSLGPVKLNLYFAASWSVQCLMLTIMMATEYSSRDKKTVTDVVVFISMDEDEDSFKRHFSMMPWLAIPFSDAEKRNSLVELFKVKKVPQLVIIDEDGNVTFDKCEGPREICPCPPERLKELKEQKEAAQRNQSLRSILVHGSGDFVISLSQGEIIPIDQLEGKTICLNFPSFSDYDNDIDERLSQVYETLKANGEDFEMVMIVPGRYDEDTIWEDLLGSSDGFALLVHPNVFGQMISYFEISSLPALVMIGRDGKTLLPSAVEAVKQYGAEAYPFTPDRLKELEMQVCLLPA